MSDEAWKDAEKLLKEENHMWKKLGFKNHVKLRIDPLCDKNVINTKSHPMLTINDCRNDISITRMSSEDKLRENVHFHRFNHNWWQYVAVVTAKEIPKNAEITVDYGTMYSNLTQDKVSCEDLMRFFEELTDLHNVAKTCNS